MAALTSIAQATGSPRIVYGTSIKYPMGDPSRDRDNELMLRIHIAQVALNSIESDVTVSTIFNP